MFKSKARKMGKKAKIEEQKAYIMDRHPDCVIYDDHPCSGEVMILEGEKKALLYNLANRRWALDELQQLKGISDGK